MIKACVFAYAGHEEETFIREQIEEALSAFRYVAELRNMAGIYKQYKDKTVFQADVRWPSIYHLRLLAYTHSWRNTDNLDTLAAAFNKLEQFSPIPPIKLLYKGQIISPASAFMDYFKPELAHLDAKGWMIWLHRTELIARLEIADRVEDVNRQIHTLSEILLKNNGLFTKAVSHYYFHKWTSYIGLALENDWEQKEARICDLTFRSLLILKLAGVSENAS
jgi:hypothetical protein